MVQGVGDQGQISGRCPGRCERLHPATEVCTASRGEFHQLGVAREQLPAAVRDLVSAFTLGCTSLLVSRFRFRSATHLLALALPTLANGGGKEPLTCGLQSRRHDVIGSFFAADDCLGRFAALADMTDNEIR
ncbi:hypothetical protein [Streptomyces sp. 2231.1]|uniref:hypothetical protein n=1 Tax=Streptomyces sp. 2231.1 TaxID=1855347 RepID=UPI00210C32F6|nr:hypothetical protein [Streptomyces sp. 2231.1]